MVERFFERGYARFGADPALANWVAAAIGPARAAMADADLRARWLTCEGTWFVGVDALPNTAEGAIGGVALAGAAVEFAQSLFGALPLHRAQVSTVWPGYPRPREGEGAAAFGYREKRDAAHVDGVRAEGAERVRRIDEPHGWILGIPLNAPGAGQARWWFGKAVTKSSGRGFVRRWRAWRRAIGVRSM
ncbi:hypothetical protein U5922_008700 [Aquicoccus sp. G2-2]|uniref:hypothetical protein n=1 Tax=Aquicoccus sp. G2-2 TaxID=3092120 RepID=UPI002ADFB602|nr:hypothetical protein [Aquicoccus sp. G2-2]MEA1113549.1 hypothetical protein [Aquicoccus sp. G2-2]